MGEVKTHPAHWKRLTALRCHKCGGLLAQRFENSQTYCLDCEEDPA